MTHDYKKQGKRNRANGKAFELKVRADLESKGWIVFRNSNDVELVNEAILSKTGERIGQFKQAKTKWNFFTKMPMSIQSGFPDFVCIRRITFEDGKHVAWEVNFCECKINGHLSIIEKQKLDWIKTNLKISILIASKIKEGRKVKVNYIMYD